MPLEFRSRLSWILAAVLTVVCAFIAKTYFVVEPLSAKRLIRETQAAIAAQRKGVGNTTSMLVELAHAQAVMGDLKEAKTTLRQAVNQLKTNEDFLFFGILIPGGASERWDFPSALPAATDGDLALKLVRTEIAMKLFSVGRRRAAEQFLPDIDRSTTTSRVLADFHLLVAADAVKRCDRTVAAASVERAENLLDGELKIESDIGRLEQIADLSFELGDRARTTAVVAWADQFGTEGTTSFSKVLALACAGRLHARLGEESASRDAFASALSRLDEAEEIAKGLEGGFDDFICRAFAWIGVRQYLAGRRDDAKASYLKAVQRAIRRQRQSEKDFTLSVIVRMQARAGDFGNATETIAAMAGGYYKVLSLCLCAETMRASDRTSKIRSTLEKAEEIADQARDPHHKTEMYGKIARVYAIDGNLAAAKRLLLLASHSASNAGPNKYQQQIAFNQIEAGFFDDAYKTIQRIDEAPTRLAPLAALAREAAKKEAMNSRDD